MKEGFIGSKAGVIPTKKDFYKSCPDSISPVGIFVDEDHYEYHIYSIYAGKRVTINAATGDKLIIDGGSVEQLDFRCEVYNSGNANLTIEDADGVIGTDIFGIELSAVLKPKEKIELITTAPYEFLISPKLVP